MKRFVPRPYQTIIVDRILRNRRVAVWAGMGMGKTVSTLTAISLIQMAEDAPALVLAPARVAITSWPNEVEKWEHLAHLKAVCLCAPKKKRISLAKKVADITTISYELLPWLVEFWGDKWPYKIVVADEATRLKSFRTRSGGSRAKALAHVAFKYVDRLIELTGTPAPNGYLDLWGQLWFLDKGKRLGQSMSQYQHLYFRPIRVGAQAFAVKWELLPGGDTRIQKAVDDIVVKLNAEDWFDLKQPIVTDIFVDLPAGARKIYKSMERNLFAEINGAEVETVNAATKTSTCLQIASGCLYEDATQDCDEATNCAIGKVDAEPEYSLGVADGIKPYYCLHQEKIDALKSIIMEAAGMPVLVAYQFRHELEQLKRFLGGEAVVLDKNPRTIKRWNEGKIRILLAHPASCGHGLSLQDGGNILVFYSTGWNLEEHDQMVERIGPTRQAQSGHNRAVFVYNIVAKDTLDEAVQERIKTKRSVMDILLEKGGSHAKA